MERVKLWLQPSLDREQEADLDLRYWLPLWRGPLQDYLGNLQTELALAVVEGQALPLAIGRYCPNNCYLASPYSHYIGYTQHYCPRLSWLLSGSGWQGLDQVLQVNQGLLSTNLYPRLSRSGWQELHRVLLQQFAGQALMFRNLDARRNGPLLRLLLQLGYRPIFSRLVFYKDPQDPRVWRRRDTLKDQRLARSQAQAGLEWREAAHWSQGDFERACQLYGQLYLQKYSPLNPDFRPAFFQHVLRAGWQMLGLFQGEQMLGVIGFWQREGVMTTPILGYDCQLSPQMGLYRLLGLRLLEEAAGRGLLLHESAGVGRFKLLRGALPEAEFSLVYCEHLDLPQRRLWQRLGRLVNGLGRPLVEALELRGN